MHFYKNNKKYLGIFREAEHSPERVLDDELILRAVAKRLSDTGNCYVRLISSSELHEIEDIPDVIFNMAEEEPVLQRLEEMEQQGVQVINSVQGVRNTFRHAMTYKLEGLPFVPKTVLTDTSHPALPDPEGVWIKRGDYHAIQKDDVVFAKTRQDMERILRRFEGRGIKQVALQSHIPGDLIKFYGVREPDHGMNGNTRWFHWFYHRDQDLKNHPFDQRELQSRCEQATDYLMVEVFGGDAIVRQDGEIFIIDVNAWPSFALFRDQAAEHIAHHIMEKVS